MMVVVAFTALKLELGWQQRPTSSPSLENLSPLAKNPELNGVAYAVKTLAAAS